MQVRFDIPVAIFDQLLGPVELPAMARVRQRIDTPPAIDDVEGAVRDQLRAADAASMFPSGSRIAVGVGSRGIGNLPRIVAALIDYLRSLGCEPFIIPTMGSHGGATAEGQRAVLAHLGVTEDTVHAPVVSDMHTVVIARTPSGMDVHMDALAMQSDGIVFVGRIKPHTAYHGPYESGLAKMIAIGLGKQTGAAATHAHGFGDMARMVPEMAGEALKIAPVRLGLAVLENAHDLPYKIVAVPANHILAAEPALLEEARSAMPRLPFDEFDVLVIDQIGKNISGDGADPNITGRFPTPYASGGPRVSKQVVLDISEESGGNGNGLGTADFTTVRAAAKMSLAATYPNALTSTVAGPVAVPMILPSDRFALAAAILTCNAVDRPPRVVRIVDTLHLQDFWISQGLLDAERANDALTVTEPAGPIEFDTDGNMLDRAPVQIQ
jgi:Lactate racemase N-terminal domain